MLILRNEHALQPRTYKTSISGSIYFQKPEKTWGGLESHVPRPCPYLKTAYH